MFCIKFTVSDSVKFNSIQFSLSLVPYNMDSKGEIGVVQPCPKSTEDTVVLVLSSSEELDKLHFLTADHNGTMS